MKEKKENRKIEKSEPTMDRKQAIKKAGYVALSAATMMLLLSIPKQAAASPADPGGGVFPN